MSPESTKPEQEKGRLLYVDGMRAGAALIVLINHVYQQVYWTVEPASRLGKKFAPLLQLGHWAVVVFIVLSGFCLMRPVVLSGDLKGGVKRFYIARALRILPAYWAAVALVLMLIATVIGRKHGIMYDVSLPVTAGGLLSHVLLLHNLAPPPYVSYSGNPEICSVFWTIALEWQIYFWFPLFVRIWQRWNAVTLVAGVGVVSTLVYYATQHLRVGGINWCGLNANFYLFFVLGMLSAVVVFSENGAHRAQNLPWSLFAVGAVVAFVVLMKLFPKRLEFHDLCAAIFATALLVVGARGGAVGRGLSFRPLAAMGLFSYSFYLLHLPILAIITDYVILPLVGHVARPILCVLLLLLSVPTVTAVAWAFARVFEDRRVLLAYGARLRALVGFTSLSQESGS